LSNWNKNVNVQWYGNLNKLIVLGVILSIPVLGFGIYLWSRYLAARIIVWVVVGLIGIGLFSMLLRWTKRAVGMRTHHEPIHHSHHSHDNHNSHYHSSKPEWKRRLEEKQRKENSHHKHKHH
jgi:hypothetical protein